MFQFKRRYSSSADVPTKVRLKQTTLKTTDSNESDTRHQEEEVLGKQVKIPIEMIETSDRDMITDPDSSAIKLVEDVASRASATQATDVLLAAAVRSDVDRPGVRKAGRPRGSKNKPKKELLTFDVIGKTRFGFSKPGQSAGVQSKQKIESTMVNTRKKSHRVSSWLGAAATIRPSKKRLKDKLKVTKNVIGSAPFHRHSSPICKEKQDEHKNEGDEQKDKQDDCHNVNVTAQDSMSFWVPPESAKTLLEQVKITEVTTNAITITIRESATDNGFFRKN